jgi:serine/threonine-protein kinase
MLGEAILLSRIGHPNIVRVFDANVTETSRGTSGFFTMEYVAGGSLEQFWRSHGNQLVPVETTVEIMRQVCRGLSVAHGERPPVVHRDIKPQNILIGYDGAGLNARVSDFGLAKRVNPLTLLASARGTRGFKAPEALIDLQSDSCAGDVWALGSSMYLLLTDRLPFTEIGDTDASDPKRFERALIPASRLNLQVDSALDSIVRKALALDPDRRYPTARELLDDLVRWSPPRAGKQSATAGLGLSDVSKSALGVQPAHDLGSARQSTADALRLASEGRLADAADLMEEAFNRWPELRDRYEYQVKLWRRGVVM